MYCLDTPGRLLGLLESNVDAEGQILAIRALPIADRNLLDVTILSEEFRLPQSLQQVFFSDGRSQACDIDKVLLDHPNPDEVLAVFLLCFALLKFFLPLVLGSSSLVLLNVGTELCNSVWRSA
jgi:hypothetical protein